MNSTWVFIIGLLIFLCAFLLLTAAGISPEWKITLTIAVFFLLSYIFMWLKKLPVRPDPWEEKDTKDQESSAEEDIPVCVNCLTPVESPFQHYCRNCGNVTGKFTRYIPFVNIAFNYSIFRTLWEKMVNPETSVTVKIFYAFFIGLFAPVMLIIGLPIHIVLKIIRKRKKRGRN